MKKLIVIISFILLAFTGYSQQYFLIENNEITLTGLPTTYTSVDGSYWFKNYRTAPDSVWYADGFRVGVTPAYDAETQRLGSRYYDIGNDVVTWTVIDKTEAEIAAQKESLLSALDNQLDVAKIKYLLQLLVEPIIDTIPLDTTNVAAFATIYEQWRIGKYYEAGEKVVKDSTLYKVTQAHTSQSDWLPENVPTLYVKYQVDTGEVLEWDYPVEYTVDDQVIYNGITYTCIQAHTSQAGWTPDVVASLWTEN